MCIRDRLYRVLDDYRDHLTIVKNETNLGLGLSLNKGLERCRNDLVARMDTDDISKQDRCQKQLLAFENDQDLAIVGSHVDEFVDVKENVVSVRKVPIEYKDIYKYGKRRSPFNHPSVMYRKSVVLKYGGYSDLRRNQDVDLFGRLLFQGCLAQNINESLLWFRTSSDLSLIHI